MRYNLRAGGSPSLRLCDRGDYTAAMNSLVHRPAATEPKLETEPELVEVLEQLSAREPIFHRAEFGVSREDFERMTAEEFWEIGASGRRYSRNFVLDELEKRYAAGHKDVWETSESHCRRLAEDVFLLTYTLVQDGTRVTRRSTIWQRTVEDWKIVFHQGTVVTDGYDPH
jgi:hypothetical protein